MRYLTYSELIYINGAVLNNPNIMSGKQKVRDIDMLQAAVARPAASAFGEDAYPTLPLKVAALLHSIARNHPFTDGNKRTAAIASLFMFAVNGERVVWDQADAVERIVQCAEMGGALDALAAWFPRVPAAPMPEPDLDADTRLIAALIDEQRWLLDELDRR